jgi:diguanylate cyclase (GGDEF)-like protein
MDRNFKALLVDDDIEEYLLVKDLVQRQSFNRISETRIEIDWVDNYETALQAMENGDYDVYLVDYRLGVDNGLDLLREVEERGKRVPVIMLTGQGNYEVDVAAMQAGAADYLVKNQLNAYMLEHSIRYAVDRRQAQTELENRVRELNALHTATSTLLKTIDLENLLKQILESARTAIPAAERGILHLLAPDTGQLTLRASFGLSGIKFNNNSHPAGESGAAKSPPTNSLRLLRHKDYYPFKAIQEKCPLLIPDTYQNPITMPLSDQEQAESSLSPGMRSLLVAPLMMSERVLGTISLAASQPSAFTPADLRLLVSFAATTTAALNNAMLHAEVQRLASTDPLTGALNRRGFFDLGDREIDRFQRFRHSLSTIVFDVDNFKGINDRYGHAAGDQVLRTVVERCRANTRQVDLIGRLGGDEFAILMPETNQTEAHEIALRIRKAVIETPVAAGLALISLSISMGISTADRSIRSLENLLNRADTALYRAKENGRNRVEIS